MFAALGCLSACGDDSASDGGTRDSGADLMDASTGHQDHDAATGNKDASVEPESEAGTLTDAATGSGSLPSGSGYSLVYVAGDNIGIDQRPDCEATFDTEGLSYYSAGAMEHLDIGSCELRSTGSNAIGAWGTWIDGTANGKFYASTSKTFDGNDDVFHYGIGKRTPKANLPSGKVTYSLVGGSAPTRDGDSAPGELKAATIKIDFATHKLTLSLKAQMADGAYARTDTGGTWGDHNAFAADNIAIRGFVLGDAGQDLVIAYSFDDGSGDDGGTGLSIQGTALLER